MYKSFWLTQYNPWKWSWIWIVSWIRMCFHTFDARNRPTEAKASHKSRVQKTMLTLHLSYLINPQIKGRKFFLDSEISVHAHTLQLFHGQILYFSKLSFILTLVKKWHTCDLKHIWNIGFEPIIWVNKRLKTS